MKKKSHNKASLARRHRAPLPHAGTLWSAPYRAVVAVALLLLLGLIVFRDFVFGSKLLLYKDIGSDSLNIGYPYLVQLSDYLRSTGYPSWSFNTGLGQSLFPFIGACLFELVVWLPRAGIPIGLVFSLLFKVLVTGMLFFKFLEMRGLCFRGALAGALFLAFSSYMTMGGCWTITANEAMCFAFVLFAAESAITRGRWAYLPVAVALAGLLTAFHLYLCALLLSLYVPARLIELHGWRPLFLARACIVLGLVAVLGVGLCAVVGLDGVAMILHSPRGSGTTSYAGGLLSAPIFGFGNPLHYFTYILRTFSNDMAGTGSNFRGWYNYLEAPLHYCGLLCVLMLPQVFVGANGRKRMLYSVVLMLIVVPVVFPWFRYLFYAFQGDYYRAFSLFSVFGIITLSMMAYSRYAEMEKLNLWLLLATLVVLLCALYFPFGGMQTLANPRLQKVATLLLLALAGVLAAGQISNRQSVASWIILGIGVLELAYFNRITAADRPVVTKQELHERVGYNDYTVEAVRELKTTDHEFYRIGKFYSSGPAIHASTNDSMVFGFNGSSSYSSFNSLHYIKFLMALGVISDDPGEGETRWARGLTGRPLLAAFACEKYALTRDPVPLQVSESYESEGKQGDIYIFRNRLFLPFGVAYERYLPESDFLRLPAESREVALMHAVVLREDGEKPSELTTIGIEEALRLNSEVSLEDMLGARRRSALKIDFFSQTKIQGEVRMERQNMMVFQMPFDPGWRVFIDGKRASTRVVDVGLLGVLVGAGSHSVELAYRPQFLLLGALISFGCLGVLAFCVWRFPSLPLIPSYSIKQTDTFSA